MIKHEKRRKGKNIAIKMNPHGQPRGMVWGGRREEGSGWGIHVCLWWIHFDIWQNQYNIVKLKNKIKLKKKESTVQTSK